MFAWLAKKVTKRENCGNANFELISLFWADEVSLISKNSNMRCHSCHVIRELHPNILQIQTSPCKSRVSHDLVFLLCTYVLSWFSIFSGSAWYVMQSCQRKISSIFVQKEHIVKSTTISMPKDIYQVGSVLQHNLSRINLRVWKLHFSSKLWATKIRAE